ncbi:hypothetical protein [Fimbriiglobus ruber]|nr:hypothetical protein [Fimbriiglobus ruber]
MTSWSGFPPLTTTVQVDEKWSYVGKKEKNCDPDRPADRLKGDCWDHVALDADSRLVVEVVVGPRTADLAHQLLDGVKGRLGGRVPALLTSDEYAAYADVIVSVFGQDVTPSRTGKPGRPAGPRKVPPAGMCYATVHKTRVKNRVVSVDERVIFGALPAGSRANTSYLERPNGTDRHRNARKGRKTYRFSKAWAAHASMTHFTLRSDNFCWAVRTLATKDASGRKHPRTPAMAAGLADHVWSLKEWVTRPGVQR